MRKLDVKEIHGYNAAHGARAAQARCARGTKGKPPGNAAAFHAKTTRGACHATVLPVARVPTRTSCCSRRRSAPSCSARPPSRATAWAWSPRPSSSAPRSRRSPRPYGVKMSIDNFTKSIFYYLFMYGVGLRVGPVVHQQPEGRRPQVHDPRGVLLGARACSAWSASRSCSDLPAGRRRRHPRRLDDHVRGDRLGRGSRAPGRVPARRRADVRGRERHDRALLRPDVHLGHGRHHPDLQVPAALVGRRRASAAAKKYEDEPSACRTSTTPASPATARSRCAPTASPTRGQRLDGAAVPAEVSAVQGRSTCCVVRRAACAASHPRARSTTSRWRSSAAGMQSTRGCTRRTWAAGAHRPRRCCRRPSYARARRARRPVAAAGRHRRDRRAARRDHRERAA